VNAFPFCLTTKLKISNNTFYEAGFKAKRGAIKVVGGKEFENALVALRLSSYLPNQTAFPGAVRRQRRLVHLELLNSGRHPVY
jgi:hypothetical protein